MIVLATLAALLAYGAHRLTVVRRTRPERIDPYRLDGWPRVSWVAAMILMGLLALALVIGVPLDTRLGFPPPEWLEGMVQLTRFGSFVLVVLSMTLALWERANAAALLAMTAMATPLAMELEAVVRYVPLSSSDQIAFTTAMSRWGVLFTLPAMLVALLLWTSVPGPGSLPGPGSAPATDRPGSA